MLKRKFTDILLNWKNNKSKECLLVKGARQIGKTFIIEDFGKRYYKSYIYINFFKNPEAKEIFSGSLEPDEIYKKISIYIKNVKFIENDTLIFLDEIQECPQARTALKFLALDDKYDIIASGSLLGINYKDIASIPVGYEYQIEMHSLDFEEFLWAKGMDSNAIEYIKSFFDKKQAVPNGINEKMFQHLREYMVVGGMPEVVNTYIATNNFNEVQKSQDKILSDYLNDIAKYAEMKERPKVRNCYLSIPRQLAKENKKFMFSVVEAKGRARKYANSIEWLRDANLIRVCNNVFAPLFPLLAHEKTDQYKIYLNDIGLLVSMYGFDMKRAILQNSLIGDTKGGIYENLIADILIKKGIKLNYYKNDNSTQEIEFLITKDANVIPIEVKAGNNHTISLDNYVYNYKPKYAYKFINGNLGVAGNKITLPLYMVMFLENNDIII